MKQLGGGSEQTMYTFPYHHDTRPAGPNKLPLAEVEKYVAYRNKSNFRDHDIQTMADTLRALSLFYL